MGIVTPPILSIVVCVAPRLISYKKESKDHIISREVTRSYHTERELLDRIIHGLQCERGKKKGNDAVQCICVVKWSSNVTLSLVFIYLLTIPDSSHPLSSLSSALSSKPLILVPLKPCLHRTIDLAHAKHSGAVTLLTASDHNQQNQSKPILIFECITHNEM